VGWADLEPWDRRARLARVHPRLKEDCLIAAGRSIPELRPEIEAQRSKEDQMRVVLRYFGDEGYANPNPGKPLRHGPGVNGATLHDCPPWERLPSLEDDEMPAAHTSGGGRIPEAEPERYGKDYPGPPVEEVVRLAHAERQLGKKLGRTFRNKVAKEVGVTTYEVDMIFRLVEAGKLADADREGWLKVADEVSATPAFINLHKLETRS
jgi:hypothetical protein